MKTATLSAAACLVALSLLGDDCEDADKSKAASSEKPGAAKLAGWEPGEVRVCALTGDSKGQDTLVVKAALGDEGMHDFTTKKQDKGYCEYMRPDWSRYGFDFVFAVAPPEGTALTEVGVYFMEDAKDNPDDGDFKYMKAAKGKDGTFRMRMTPDVAMPTVKFKTP